MHQTIIIGSRDSKLALIQTEMVKEQLLALNPDLEIEIIKIKSEGDLILDKPLAEIPQGDVKGLFTKELEQALLAGQIDLAVHSMKDLPTTLPSGLEIACVSKREDLRDVVCFSERAKSEGIDHISKARIVATSSPRRIAQLKKHYPHLAFRDMRGNLNTRFRKLDESQEIDAIILAAAGLKRQGLSERISQYLDPREILPAVGQGVLAVEIATNRDSLKNLLKQINSYEDDLIVRGERAFLRKLEGGCSAPVGIYARLENRNLSYMGSVISLDGSQQLIQEISGLLEDAEAIAEELADRLLGLGAKELMGRL